MDGVCANAIRAEEGNDVRNSAASHLPDSRQRRHRHRGYRRVGKSTLTCCIAAALGFRPSLEKADNPYLPRFYTDQRRWSFHLQVYFLAERFKEQMRLFQSGGGFVQDRTLYEDAGIFARMLYENGLMAPEDYRTYRLLADAMIMTPSFPHPDVLIYLEGPLPLILDRVARRGRAAERNTPVAYWDPT